MEWSYLNSLLRRNKCHCVHYLRLYQVETCQRFPRCSGLWWPACTSRCLRLDLFVILYESLPILWWWLRGNWWLVMGRECGIMLHGSIALAKRSQASTAWQSPPTHTNLLLNSKDVHLDVFLVCSFDCARLYHLTINCYIKWLHFMHVQLMRYKLSFSMFLGFCVSEPLKNHSLQAFNCHDKYHCE